MKTILIWGCVSSNFPTLTDIPCLFFPSFGSENFQRSWQDCSCSPSWNSKYPFWLSLNGENQRRKMLLLVSRIFRILDFLMPLKPGSFFSSTIWETTFEILKTSRNRDTKQMNKNKTWDFPFSAFRKGAWEEVWLWKQFLRNQTRSVPRSPPLSLHLFHNSIPFGIEMRVLFHGKIGGSICV